MKSTPRRSTRLRCVVASGRQAPPDDLTHNFNYGLRRRKSGDVCKDYRIGNTLPTLCELLEHGPPDMIVKEFARLNTMAAKTDKRCQQFAEEVCSELSVA